MNWFTDLTGLDSDLPTIVRAGIAVEGQDLVIRKTGRRLRAGTLTLPNLADLRRMPKGRPGQLRLRETIADTAALHADPANTGAVFQVASQFNLLEMTSPDITPDDGIARYAHDHTQGPVCGMACAAGTIWRNYLVPVGDAQGQSAHRQIDTAKALGDALGNADGTLWRMVNGYLLPHAHGFAAINRAIARNDPTVLTGLLQVGLQADTEVTIAPSAHRVTQVYCSALPIAYASHPLHLSEPLARLVLNAAYEATLRIALLSPLPRPKLFLTRLGGGAFGNPPDWINDAILAALALARNRALDVEIVSYGQANPHNTPLLAAFGSA